MERREIEKIALPLHGEKGKANGETAEELVFFSHEARQ